MLIKMKQEKFRQERKEQRAYQKQNQEALKFINDAEMIGQSVAVIIEQTNHSDENSYKQMLRKLYQEIKIAEIKNKVPVLLKEINYISGDDLAEYELNFDENGVARLASGDYADGEYIFVRLENGETYVTNELHRHHSHFSNGKKVQAAGKLFFSGGVLYLISNDSGHYTPTNHEMLEQVKYYFALAKNDDELIYEDHSSIPLNDTAYRYFAKNIVQMDSWVESKPVEIIKNKSSNFGKQSKSLFRSPLVPDFNEIELNNNALALSSQSEKGDMMEVSASSGGYLDDDAQSKERSYDDTVIVRRMI